MKFVILKFTNYGWSDYLGSVQNLWDSEDQAEDAVDDLTENAGFFGIWKIVKTTDLHNYKLVH